MKIIDNLAFEGNHDSDIEFTLCTLKSLCLKTEILPVTIPHRLHFYSLIIITEGEGYHYIDFKKYHYKAGSVFILEPSQVHYFELNNESDGYIFTFTENLIFSDDKDQYRTVITQLFENHNHVTMSLNVDNIIEQQALNLILNVQLLIQEYNIADDVCKEEILRSLLRVLLLKIVRFYPTLAEKYHPDFIIIKQFKQQLEENFRITRQVTDYTNTLGCTPKKINHICKALTGFTAKELIDSRVILEIKRLLAYSNISINEMAEYLGFDEATNLAKFFKRHTQLSPKEFRSVSRIQKTTIRRAFY